MSNIENQKIEVPESPETSDSQQGIDMNDRVEATGQATSDVWEGEIGDLPDEPYEPIGNEVTVSSAHENVSRTEFAAAPDVKEDFNKAAEPPPDTDKQTDETDRSDHNLNPPDPPAPHI
ncbi:MAG TPA: hypothetical protein VF735_21375 [Pyrinomonadaceae bacterium]|jgi:hypothetical protein